MKNNSGIKVSIIVPVYNVATYLPECLNSLINQTLKDIEIICIDDKSTDGSIEILKEYEKKDVRIKVVYNEENKSTGTARNIGIEKASGEYLGFVDGDDFVSADYFENLYENAKKHNAEISATSNVLFYYDENNTPELETGLSVKSRLSTIKEKNDSLAKTVVSWNKIYKKDFIEKNNIYYGNNSYAEDMLFSIICYFFAPYIVISHKSIYYYRKDRQGSATTGLKDLDFVLPAIDNMKTLYKVFENSNHNENDKRKWKNIFDACTLKYLRIALNTLKTQWHSEFLQISSKELSQYNIKKYQIKRLNYNRTMLIFYFLSEMLTLKKQKTLTRKRRGYTESTINTKRALKFFE